MSFFVAHLLNLIFPIEICYHITFTGQITSNLDQPKCYYLPWTIPVSMIRGQFWCPFLPPLWARISLDWGYIRSWGFENLEDKLSILMFYLSVIFSWMLIEINQWFFERYCECAKTPKSWPLFMTVSKRIIFFWFILK